MSTVSVECQMACPRCRDDDHLQVSLSTMAHLTPDGTEPFGDQEWDADSFMRCAACGYCGIVSDFGIDPDKQTAVPTITTNNGERI